MIYREIYGLLLVGSEYKHCAFRFRCPNIRKTVQKICIIKNLHIKFGNLKFVITLATRNREVEQLVARRAHNPKVVGSSPSFATKKNYLDNEKFRILAVAFTRLILKSTFG